MSRPRADLVALAAGLLVLAVVSVAVVAGFGSGPNRPESADAAAPPQISRTADVRRAIIAGQTFLRRYVAPGGRVVWREHGGDTVSAGQGYAMLIAVAVDDRERFQALWQWTQEHLQRSDKLFASQWNAGAVTNDAPASGGDLDIARALLIGAERWQETALKAQALEIGRSILANETLKVDKRSVLLAGPRQPSGQPVVNPGAFSPRAFQALQAATSDRRWQELQDTSLDAIDDFTAKQPSLPPDWAGVQGSKLVPSSAPDEPATGVRYAYEAARVLPRFAEMCPADKGDAQTQSPATGRQLVARAWPFMRSFGRDGPTADLRTDGRPIGGNISALATVAAAATADSAGDFAARDRLFARSQQIQSVAPTYIGGAWIALGRIMLTTNLLGDCNSPGAVQ